MDADCLSIQFKLVCEIKFLHKAVASLQFFVT